MPLYRVKLKRADGKQEVVTIRAKNADEAKAHATNTEARRRFDAKGK